MEERVGGTADPDDWDALARRRVQRVPAEAAGIRMKSGE
jgi:hypothetical protein